MAASWVDILRKTLGWLSSPEAVSTRFWLGITSTDSNISANWSLSSGGSGGAAVPTSGNTVTLDGSGDNPMTLTANMLCSDFETEATYTADIDLNGLWNTDGKWTHLNDQILHSYDIIDYT